MIRVIRIFYPVFILFCLAASFNLNAFAANSEPQELNYKIELLETLRVHFDSNKLSDVLSRKEAVRAIAVLCKLQVANNGTTFKDVDEKDQYANYIEAVYSAGLISGYSDNSFKPDNPITYAEFSKMIITVLGYSDYAMTTGGYPIGYMSLMAENQLFKGSEFADYNNNVTKKDAVMLLFNMLHTDMMSVSSISADAKNYQVIKGNTLLSERHNIKLISGLVTANQVTSLYSAMDKVPGIEIEGNEYLSAGDFGKYLGYIVKAYVFDDEELVYLYPDKNNEVTIINSEQIIESNKNLIRIETEKGKEIKYNIEDSSIYFFNGEYVGNMATSAVTDGDMSLENCTYTLLDNNKDGRYDLIFADKYQYFKVISTDKNNLYLFDDFTKSKIIFNKKDRIYFSDGNPADFSVLKYNDILAGKISKNMDLQNRNEGAQFIILDKTVYGIVSEISTTDVVINSKHYELNFEYGLNKDKIYNKTGLFFLDANDKIIAFDANTQADIEVYAFIAAIEEESMNNIEVKILLQNEGLTVKPLSQKARAIENGKDDVKGSHNILNLKDEIINKLVKVVFSDNEIVKIILPEEIEYGSNGEKDKHNILPKAKYTTRSGILNDLYNIPTNVTAFIVPFDMSDNAVYRTTNRKGISFTETNFECEVYGIDDNYTASAILVRQSNSFTGPIKADADTLVIDRCTSVLNKDGNESIKIRGMFGGALKEYVFKDPEMMSVTWDDSHPNTAARKRSIKVDELGFGDVILITEENGEINSFRVLLDYSADSEFAYSSADEYQDGIEWSVSYPFVSKASIYTFGSIKAKGDEYVTYSISNVDKNVFLSRLKNIYLVDTDNKKITKVHPLDSEFVASRKVFVNFIWGNERDFIIYK